MFFLRNQSQFILAFKTMDILIFWLSFKNVWQAKPGSFLRSKVPGHFFFLYLAVMHCL